MRYGSSVRTSGQLSEWGIDALPGLGIAVAVNPTHPTLSNALRGGE